MLVQYQQMLRIKPNDFMTANNAAWVLATSSSDSVRNPAEAVRLAELVCQRTKQQLPQALDTLAAAYASAGQFEQAVTTAKRAIELARAWTRGEVTMTQARTAAGYANAAARALGGSGRHAAYAAGQAAAVAHVAAHQLGAAAYAIKAVRAAAPRGESESAGRRECQWQREQLPDAIRDLVLDDQRLRNDICWSVFDC